MKQNVLIPTTRLGHELNNVRVQQIVALRLLNELEARYLGTTPEKPGSWRQDTQSFRSKKR